MNVLQQTADGSFTFYNEAIGEHYHSAHGALQESQHVFLEAGFYKYLNLNPQKKLNILEMGFGTGLNFLLTASAAQKEELSLNYTGIEAFPLSSAELLQTNYQVYLEKTLWENYLNLYPSFLIQSDATQNIKASQHLRSFSDNIQLEILVSPLQNLKFEPNYDIIYYDAFSVRHQPELWTPEIIAQIGEALKPGGIFVSYAITGNLKRALKAAGFSPEKVPGPPGKREMIRAYKL